MKWQHLLKIWCLSGLIPYFHLSFASRRFKDHAKLNVTLNPTVKKVKRCQADVNGTFIQYVYMHGKVELNQDVSLDDSLSIQATRESRLTAGSKASINCYSQFLSLKSTGPSPVQLHSPLLKIQTELALVHIEQINTNRKSDMRMHWSLGQFQNKTLCTDCLKWRKWTMNQPWKGKVLCLLYILLFECIHINLIVSYHARAQLPLPIR